MKTKSRIRNPLMFAAVAVVAFVLAGPGARAEIVDGLVEYWAFDGDYVAGLDPTHVGVPTTSGTGTSSFVPGKFDQCVDLENSVGNQAYVVVGGDENAFDFAGGSMSFSVWYTTQSLYTAFQCLIGKGENASWRVARQSTTATNIKLSVAGAIGNGQIALQDGSWHHVVGTYDALAGTTLYVDGSLVGSTGAAYTLSNVPTPMQIGGNPQAAGRGWDGNIDDVAVWNRVLTVDEVAAIWNDGAGASIGSLIGAGAPPFAITVFDYAPSTGMATLTWNSRAGESYVVKYSFDMVNWDADLQDGVMPDEGETTTRTYDLTPLSAAADGAVFIRIEKE